MARIGIDLGTTNSVVSIYTNGQTKIIPINGQNTTPSVVFFEESGKKVVGHTAKDNIPLYPDRIIQSSKRHMGSDETFNVAGKSYTPIDAASFILSYLKEEAGRYLGEEVRDVVITVPAYFPAKAIEDTAKAAKMAGLNPVRLIPEPVSAAIAYGFDKSVNQTLLVVDLGGGTFDVTVLEVETNPDGTSEYKEKLTDGNHCLGGDDFDNAIVEYLINQGAPANKQKELKAEAEKIKIQLSVMNKVNVDLPSHNFSCMITREDYKQLIKKYIDEMTTKIRNTVNSSGKDMDDINRVVLVGGSCKHPIIQEAVKSLVGRDPYIAPNMDTVVAEGAALTHHIDSTFNDNPNNGGGAIKLAVPISLGTAMRCDDVLTNVKLIDKGTYIPAGGLKVAVVGFVNEGQEIVRTQVVQGEAKLFDDPQNTVLGEVEMQLAQRDYNHPVAVVFKVDDKTRQLSFVTHEISLNKNNLDDVQEMYEHVDSDTNLIDWALWEQFEKKHSSSLQTKVLTLDNALK